MHNRKGHAYNFFILYITYDSVHRNEISLLNYSYVAVELGVIKYCVRYSAPRK